MRRFPLALLLTLFAIAPVAQADTFQFSFQGDYQPPVIPGYNPLGAGATLTVAFEVTGAPDASIPYDDLVFYTDTLVVSSDPYLSGLANVAPNNGDGVTLLSTNGDFYSTAGFADIYATKGILYAGPDSDPAFISGRYDAEFDFHTYSIYDGTLTIADESTVTPEPSTFALLGTGLVGIAGVFRRKLRR